ncbi:MAG: methylated-DNA--[protein]-cysteine S-methyltransferase [Methanolinea sp.]|nr:methylated-DNA--[protein]-cysteine S-methyltransferase [Methanolinea sp.]
MAVIEGSCRFGFWHIHVTWSGDLVYRVRFSPCPIDGPVPLPVQRYTAGLFEDFSSLRTVAMEPESPFLPIYRRVRSIPYGETRTYGQVGADAGASPRVVGLAMSRNPTPLVIPCHRVVAAGGLGGYTPSPEIKEALLTMEQKNKRRLTR